jgi:peptide/nickel transport system substrate-binding protein
MGRSRSAAGAVNRNGATLRDVARFTGTTPMTVSNVVNARVGQVGPELTRRVMEACAQLGYRPHAAARKLRTNRRMAIGVIIVDPSPHYLSDPFTSALLAGLNDVLGAQGYSMLLHGGSLESVAQAPLMSRIETDALCLVGSGAPGDTAGLLRQLLKLGQPVALLQDDLAEIEGDLYALLQDDRAGGIFVARHMFIERCRHPVMLVPALRWPAMERREAGIREVMAELGVAAPLHIVRCGDESFDDTQAALARHIAVHGVPDVVMGGNDRMAIAAMKLLAERGVFAPGMVRISGFNGFDFWRYATPELTTVRSPAFRLGEECGRALLARLETGVFPARRTVLPVEFAPNRSSLTGSNDRIATSPADRPQATNRGVGMMQRKMTALRTLALAGTSLAASFSGAFAQGFSCPRTGGDLIFALEARVPSLDQHASNSTATRNIAVNVFESLITRDENLNPVLDLAESLTEAPDKLSYTFKLRPGITFHNGKPLSSADVAASFARYRRLGIDRSILDPVDGWETPDPATFVIRLKRPLPTFVEQLSSFVVPIVIIPAELAEAPAQQLQAVGTGPFQVEEFRADSFVKLKRFAGYKPDTRQTQLNGFAGWKQACLDTVTFRMMTEPAARTAALEVGEIHGVEDVPVASQKRLAANNALTIARNEQALMNVTYPNFSNPPTDNPKVRQAILAAMDFDEIMDAASEGVYKLNPGFQYPGQLYFTDAGKQNLNQKNKDKARRLLAEAGYKGEKVTLLTNREFPMMYNTSLVMAEQLKAVGINAELLVLDWPAALAKSQKETEGWNFFYTFWATVVAIGGPQTMRQMAPPASVQRWKDEPDPEFMAAVKQLAEAPTIEERRAGFAKAQERALDLVMAIPFGVMPKTQAVRANVQNFKSYYVLRLSNVWLRN